MFADRLKKLRLEKNLTQQQIADFLGITRQGYAKYEKRKDGAQPDLDTLNRLAVFFDVTTDYLITGTAPEENNNKSISKDEKDIAKRLERFKKDLTTQDGLMFSGEPMSEEALESLMEAMEYAFRQTQRINKKYTPKKYRKDDDVD